VNQDSLYSQYLVSRRANPSHGSLPSRDRRVGQQVKHAGAMILASGTISSTLRGTSRPRKCLTV
jgi:hypothetical protein